MDIADLCGSIQTLLEPFFVAYDRIKNSERLRRILWLILYIGNYINQGSTRGNALGFSFEYLTALKPLKAIDPEINMLSFLVDLVSREFPDLGNIISDLSSVRMAKETKLKDVDELVTRFAETRRTVAKIVESYKAFPPPPNRPTELDETTDTFLLATKIPWLINSIFF